jgi:hypothetical protein
MKKYTEEDLRKAFVAGLERGAFVQSGSYFDAPLDENEYIESLNPKEVEEDKIYFTYSFLKRKLEWEQFCELTGVDYYATRNGFEIKDTDIFYVIESKAKQFNLI